MLRCESAEWMRASVSSILTKRSSSARSGQDALDRDELLEAFGRDDASFVNLGHAAHGDLLEELVLAELHAGRLDQGKPNDVPGLRGRFLGRGGG